jgi:threonyl-tRNA synthetase
MNKKNNIDNLRHSAAHLLASAVLEIFPSAKPTIGPSIEEGFYYDFDFSTPISEADLPKIEEKMKEHAKRFTDFQKIEVTSQEAREQFKNNEYKLELIDELEKNGEAITFYKSGDFIDLCRGGHIENPSESLKNFKLLSIAGAYWRGSEKNKMLTRIYGTAFFTKEDLDAFLMQKEEAKKRDHRKLGQELGLFFISDDIGKGLIMWLPKGNLIKDQIEKLAREKEVEYGYMRVSTPHIAKENLYLKSGHLPYYKESMFPGMKMDDATYYLKAMNCPHHHIIFKHSIKTYKDLPVRLAEYGTCYRNELSGTLAGLLRVRGMSMNDAHIYLKKDQIKDEFKAVIKLTQEYFKLFGLQNYWFRLSKWDPKHTEKYIDEPENWEYTEKILRETLEEMNVQFSEVGDEAAFYGPKVDVQFKSIIGREETMSTIQLDFAAKKRFELTYIDQNGNQNNDVFVIHRAPLSVHERLLAFLIEHYAGAFPLWLSPTQVSLIPIAERHNDYAKKVLTDLTKVGLRAEIDSRSESMQKKIRIAQSQKVNYMIIIGDKEVETNNLSIRTRAGVTGNISTSNLIEKLTNLNSQRSNEEIVF